VRLFGLMVLMTAGCSDFNVIPEVQSPDVDQDTLPDSGTDQESNIPDDVMKGGVQGTICETADSGMAGVQILVEHEWGVAQTITDDTGYYEILDLPVGDHVLIATSIDYFDQISVHVSANEVVQMLSDECNADCDISVPCVGLAEAIDRDGAIVSLNDQGIVIKNTSVDLQICLDEWIVVLSDESQDAGVGQIPMVHLTPGKSHTYGYAIDIYDDKGDEAWWCLERWQYTAPGSAYSYNGSLMPRPIHNFVKDRTDTNVNTIEDHVDVGELALQTQHNLWNTEAENPVVLVGRQRSLVELVGESMRRQVVIQVRNLGQQPGTASVTEVIPPGYTAFDLQPLGSATTMRDGSTQLTWVVSLKAAVPDLTLSGPTIYDQVDLSYRIRVSDPEVACEGRCLGQKVVAKWQDSAGSNWTSYSEPLIIEHCRSE
jgi:hypothetical protein